MYAIFQSGGKQYRAEEGSKLRVEKLDLEEGSPFETDQVLLLRTEKEVLVGKPLVSGAVVTGKVLRNGKDDKVLIFKKKRRKQYRRTVGHRQPFTEIEIEKITLPQPPPET